MRTLVVKLNFTSRSLVFMARLLYYIYLKRVILMIVIIDTTRGKIQSPQYPNTPQIKEMLNEVIAKSLRLLVKRKVTYLKLEDWGVLLNIDYFKSIEIKSV
ncbi:hypothetical protein CR166_05320 [Ligilactobacillus salivarius]|nr:hypothetical protein CR166_05320 [Ligilactobacillus salivarius]